MVTLTGPQIVLGVLVCVALREVGLVLGVVWFVCSTIEWPGTKKGEDDV